MKNLQTKTIYVIIAVILLVVIAIAIAKRLTRTTENNSSELSTDSSSDGSSSSSYSEFPLRLGIYNSLNVKKLQKWLNGKLTIEAPLSLDGDFGEKTEALLYAKTGKKEMSYIDFITNSINTIIV